MDLVRTKKAENANTAKARRSGQLTGMTGLYLVAAELSKLGYIASPTSRSAQGADLLVTDPDCRRTFSVQVKTNASTFNFWLMGKKNLQMRSPTLIYALVNLRKDRTEYFIVPSDVVAQNIQVSQSGKKSQASTDVVSDALIEVESSKTNTWYAFYYKVAQQYENNWKIFDGEALSP
jgi:hypothetical protein